MEADAARLDQRGAVHTNVASPGTYLVEWREPGYPTPDGRPWTWWEEWPAGDCRPREEEPMTWRALPPVV